MLTIICLFQDLSSICDVQGATQRRRLKPRLGGVCDNIEWLRKISNT